MPSLEIKLEAHHVLTYRDTVAMVAQQRQSRLRGAVTEVSARGEAMSAADLVGTVEAIELQGRDRRNIENVGTNSRRWLVFPEEIASGQYIDREDQLRQLSDPTSAAVRTHTMAVRRAIDDRIMGVVQVAKGVYDLRPGGILGGATDGKRPGAARIDLPGDCITGPNVGGNPVGLTLEKLMEATERLKTDDFGLEDDDELFCAITPKQVTDLLNIAAATGTHLNQFELDQIRSGKPTTLVGVNWIVTNRVYKDKSDDRWCPIWSKNNIVMGVWQDIEGRIWPDSHRRNTPYCDVSARVDVVRVEDRGVHVIKCRE